MESIFLKLQQLEQIKNIMPNFLPRIIMSNCVVANLKDSILTLVTNSPAWKHRLNFLKMDLLEELRKSSPLLAGLSAIKIKIDYLQEDLQKYHDNISEYYKCFNKSHTLNNKINQIKISQNTSKLIENIIYQNIKYQPLLDAFKNLLTKITDLKS